MLNKGTRRAARHRRHKRNLPLLAAALSATTALAPLATRAADPIVWDRGAGTLNWGDAANWQPNTVPGAGDDVLLSTSGIAAGDVFDLGGTTRALNSLWLNHFADPYAIAHGTLNLRGSDAVTGYNLQDWSPNVTLAADVLLGDPAASGGAATFTWNLGSGTLAVTGSILKASAAQKVTLKTVIGTLLFTGPAALHDDTVVNGGSIVFRPASGGSVSFGTGTISTDVSSPFVLSGSTSQEYALTNATGGSTPDSQGLGAFITLESMPGANPTFALTGRQRVGVNLRMTGANSNPIIADVRGDIDRTGVSYGTIASLDNPTGAAVRISGSIIGGTGGTITGTGKLLLAGPANTMAGVGLTKSIFVEVAAGTSMGVGSVSVRDDARLRLTDLATNLAPTAAVTVDGRALVEFPGTPAATALARIATSSTGVFGLTGEPTGMDFNARGLNSLMLGAATDLAVHDAWTPSANHYRIWGGWGGATLTLDAPNLLTGATAFFLHGPNTGLGGHTVIAQPQDLGGDTWIMGGTLTLKAARALGTTDVWIQGGTLEVAAAGALDAGQVEFDRTGTLVVAHPDGFRTDAAAPTPVLKVPYGKVAFDTGNRTGATAYDLSVTATGNSPNMEVRAASDGARASIHDLGMGFSTVNFGVPAGATVRTGLRVAGATTFASGAVFNVTAPADATASDAGGAFLALDGPVTASKSGLYLVKSGPGTLGLFNTANAFGGVTVNGGLVVFEDPAALLGSPSASVNLSGGGLRYAGAGPATLGESITVGTAGGTLDASGQGVLTLAGVINGGSGTVGLVKTGPGAVVLSAANSPLTGAVHVQGGTLRVSGSLPSSSGITVSAGATFEADATQALGSLAVAAGGAARVTPGGHKVLTVRALDLAPADPTGGAGGATLDLADGGLVYDYTGGTTPLANLRDRVRSAYAGGTWTGPGITSSAATAYKGQWGVGFAEARDVVALVGGTGTFMGASVDDTAVLVRTTVLGDATLDGVVNFNDLLALARHYNASGSAAVWSAGDFSYDGVVNFDDLLLLAKHYNGTFPAAAAIPGAPPDFSAETAAAFAAAAVPEPSTGALAIAAAACTAVAPRRRRRGA